MARVKDIRRTTTFEYTIVHTLVDEHMYGFREAALSDHAQPAFVAGARDHPDCSAPFTSSWNTPP